MGSLHLVGFDHTNTPEKFSPYFGIFKMRRVPPHFFSSRGIPRDQEKFSWRGGGKVLPNTTNWTKRLKRRWRELHMEGWGVDKSSCIARDEEKWEETLTILKMTRNPGEA